MPAMRLKAWRALLSCVIPREFVMDLLGAYRHGRFCPARWLVWMANWGLSLSGAPVAFEPRGRFQGGALRAATHTRPCRVAQ